MKKLLILTFALSSFAAFSQIGIRAGWQNSNMFYDGTETIGSNLHFFYVGAYKNFDLASSFIQFHAGAEYTRVGWSENDNNYRRIDCINIPLGVRLNLGPIFAQGGIGPNIALREEYYIAGVDVLNDDNKMNTFDWPAHLGVGLTLGPLVIEARYYLSLTTANDDGRAGFLQFGGAIQL